jgi:hypothetical protein
MALMEVDEAEFSRATAILQQLLGLPQIRNLLEAEDDCSNAARVYTRVPTLWLLVVQRLGGGLTLDQAVAQLLEHHQDLLPNNKRVREGTLSQNNSAYNRARLNLPLNTAELFARSVCDHIASMAPTPLLNKRVFILDGTTITLPPTPSLRKAFPPAVNSRAKSVRPVALLAVAHELQTGCALVPKVAPMYGPNNSSESKMSKELIDDLPKNSVVMADSGFGIFSMAHHCCLRGHRFLFRLTKQRFLAYVKSAEIIESTTHGVTYRLVWKPSKHDRHSSLELTDQSEVEAFLHEVRLPGGEMLYLIANLEVDAKSASDLYCSRYKVEFDIRDFKVTMDTENIRAKSVDTMMKELLASSIAYNLVMLFRRQAAESIRVMPRELSFQGVWTTFQYQLLYKDLGSYQEWEQAFAKAIKSAASRRLPKRTEARTYPRKSIPRRGKETKFEKSLRKKKKSDDPPSANTT